MSREADFVLGSGATRRYRGRARRPLVRTATERAHRQLDAGELVEHRSGRLDHGLVGLDVPVLDELGEEGELG
ncbi:MAG: hypothetical protein ACLP36_11825 [Acidimicrobiales bacterium]